MKKKILVADDSITIQKVIQMSFPKEEYEVLCAGNGKEALNQMESFSPDIVLTDVIMPESDGYALCQAIKSSPSFSHIPVLMLVGAFEPFDEKKAEDSGVDEIINKPFNRAMLVEKVKRMLQPDIEEEKVISKKSEEASDEISFLEDHQESGPEDFPISLDKDSVIDLSDSAERAKNEAEEIVTDIAEKSQRAKGGIPEARKGQKEEKEGEEEKIRLTEAEIEAIAKKLISSLPKNLLGDIIKASITEVAERIIKEKIKELEEKASG